MPFRIRPSRERIDLPLSACSLPRSPPHLPPGEQTAPGMPELLVSPLRDRCAKPQPGAPARKAGVTAGRVKLRLSRKEGKAICEGRLCGRAWKEAEQHPAHPTLTPRAGEYGTTFSCKCVLKENVQFLSHFPAVLSPQTSRVVVVLCPWSLSHTARSCQTHAASPQFCANVCSFSPLWVGAGVEVVFSLKGQFQP